MKLQDSDFRIQRPQNGIGWNFQLNPEGLHFRLHELFTWILRFRNLDFRIQWSRNGLGGNFQLNLSMLILKVLRWVLRILTWFLDFGILIFRFSMLELVKVEISKFSSLKLFELSWFEYENNPDNGVLNKGQGVISQFRDLDFWTLRHQISKNGNFRFKILNASRDMVDAKMARTLRKIS